MADRVEVMRQLMRHESEMLNQRMTWLLTLQGFLFAGLAFGWEKGAAICVVFSTVGILSSVSFGMILRYGIEAGKVLEERAKEETTDPVIGRGYSETHSLIHFLLPWHFVPVLFCVAWTLLGVIRIWYV